MADLERTEAVRVALEQRFSQDRRVTGVGIGTNDDGQFIVRVHLVGADDQPELEAEIDGVPVRVVVVGRAAAQVL